MWPWKLASSKECVITQQPNGMVLQMDGFFLYHLVAPSQHLPHITNLNKHSMKFKFFFFFLRPKVLSIDRTFGLRKKKLIGFIKMSI